MLSVKTLAILLAILLVVFAVSLAVLNIVSDVLTDALVQPVLFDGLFRTQDGDGRKEHRRDSQAM